MNDCSLFRRFKECDEKHIQESSIHWEVKGIKVLFSLSFILFDEYYGQVKCKKMIQRQREVETMKKAKRLNHKNARKYKERMYILRLELL